jgi:hypothetical protein
MAAELVELSKTLAVDSNPRIWINANFNPARLGATTMASHQLSYTAKSRTQSILENCFNIWKKYLKSKLKRSLLNESFNLTINQIEKRIINDAQAMKLAIGKGHFIDMRKPVSLVYSSQAHKKRKSTLVVFEKEQARTQDKDCCLWSERILVGEKMWLLQERVYKHDRERAEDCIKIHVVSLKGFIWKDCPTNVPPTCLTCPTFLNTKCPCVGIQRALLNVNPDVGELTLSQWLLGKGIFKPEIFNNRLRIDKDPTIHLPRYFQCVVPETRVVERGVSTAALGSGVATSDDVGCFLKDLQGRIARLNIHQQPKGGNLQIYSISYAMRCTAMNNASFFVLLTRAFSLTANYQVLFFLREADRRVQRFELDAEVAVTAQGRSQVSKIAYKVVKKGEKRQRMQPKPISGSDARMSAVGTRNDLFTPFVAAPVFKPPGNSDGTDPLDQWHCEACNRSVKNTSDLVQQHRKGRHHIENIVEWPVDKPFQPFICSICHTSMNNDPKLLRSHRKICAANKSAEVRLWHCDACNLDIPADALSVNTHNALPSHLRQHRYDQDNRDGSILADKVREEHEENMKDKEWISVFSKGKWIRKLVKKRQNAASTGQAAAGGKNDVC